MHPSDRATAAPATGQVAAERKKALFCPATNPIWNSALLQTTRPPAVPGPVRAVHQLQGAALIERTLALTYPKLGHSPFRCQERTAQDIFARTNSHSNCPFSVG